MYVCVGRLSRSGRLTKQQEALEKERDACKTKLDGMVERFQQGQATVQQLLAKAKVNALPAATFLVFYLSLFVFFSVVFPRAPIETHMGDCWRFSGVCAFTGATRCHGEARRW